MALLKNTRVCGPRLELKTFLAQTSHRKTLIFGKNRSKINKTFLKIWKAQMALRLVNLILDESWISRQLQNFNFR